VLERSGEAELPVVPARRSPPGTPPGRASLYGIGLALVVAAVFLGIGSVHRAVSSDASRINYLESVLKCPSCEDLSIGQSRDPVALRLDAQVTDEVERGLTNSAIESSVLAEFPHAILLPQGGLGALVIALPLGGIALGGAAVGLVLWRRRRAVATSAVAGDEALVAGALVGGAGRDDD
jgi:cytochrome c-type biogenesis protein CcmH/NrfF